MALRNRSSALAGIAMIQMKEEDYKNAIKSFNAALQLDPDNLEHRCNRAMCYLKTNAFDDSEFEYRTVLDKSPCHLDALVGISEVYIRMGDSIQEKDADEAEDRYLMALHHLNEALSLVENENYEDNEASKKLTKEELSALYYSVGYLKVKLFESQKRSNMKYLYQAKRAFLKVENGSKNYFKALRSIKKIKDRIADYEEIKSSGSARLVVGISVLIFIFSQLAFFIGKPDFQHVSFSANRDGLASLIKESNLKIPDADVASFLVREWRNREEVVRELSALFKRDTTNKISPARLEAIVSEGRDWRFSGFVPIDATLYGILTFGSLIFIIAGLYLKELSKLKVGGIELEKRETQGATVPTSLNISR